MIIEKDDAWILNIPSIVMKQDSNQNKQGDIMDVQG